MRASPRSDLRASLAGLLVALLALASVGRGFTAVPDLADPHLARVAVPICHATSGAPRPSRPDRPPADECCSACALLAAAILPSGPTPSRPGPLLGLIARVVVPIRPPEIARRHSPRQARAPPRG